MTINCCVCGESDNIIKTNLLTSKCSNSHKICVTCYLSVIEICYCNNEMGKVVYKCPLCRNVTSYSNADVYKLLVFIGNSNDICIRVHNECEDNNIIKRCKFEECGCRENIVDLCVRDPHNTSMESLCNMASNFLSLNKCNDVINKKKNIK